MSEISMKQLLEAGAGEGVADHAARDVVELDDVHFLFAAAEADLGLFDLAQQGGADIGDVLPVELFRFLERL